VWRAVSESAITSGTVGSPIDVPIATPAARLLRLRVREIEAYGAGQDAGPGSERELTGL
jgi:hypothetical protein